MSVGEPQTDTGYFAEFLDDYFAECDEHLIIARRVLLSLEASVDQPQADRVMLDELFRSFHSLKGGSGMVGVREAEQLAHEMESYLRILRQAEVTLTPEGMDALIAGTRVLEEVITARRNQDQAPDISLVLNQLTAVTSDKKPSSVSLALARNPAVKSLHKELNSEESRRLEAASQNGLRAWRF